MKKVENGFGNLYIDITISYPSSQWANFITLYQRHSGLDEQMMNKCIDTYEKVRFLHLERWSKNIRNWKLSSYVSLTPIKEDEYTK